MEKLLQLINEYEESRWNVIDDWLAEEERENWVIPEEQPTRKEYEWHLRHCNANTVAYEKDTFDYRALSKKYWFIEWLWKENKIRNFIPSEINVYIPDSEYYDDNSYESILNSDGLIRAISVKEDPIKFLIRILS